MHSVSKLPGQCTTSSTCIFTMSVQAVDHHQYRMRISQSFKQCFIWYQNINCRFKYNKRQQWVFQLKLQMNLLTPSWR